jgi:predicted nuclease of predicted toxin-antitoxin system
VVLLGMESASDREIWKTAQDNDFVIVTRDADFEELSVVLGQPPKIIWLKVKNYSRAVILKILIDNLITIEDALFAKNLACLELT